MAKKTKKQVKNSPKKLTKAVEVMRGSEQKRAKVADSKPSRTVKKAATKAAAPLLGTKTRIAAKVKKNAKKNAKKKK